MHQFIDEELCGICVYITDKTSVQINMADDRSNLASKVNKSISL